MAVFNDLYTRLHVSGNSFQNNKIVDNARMNIDTMQYIRNNVP